MENTSSRADDPIPIHFIPFVATSMPAHLQLQLCITSSGALLYYRVSVSQLCVSVSSVPVCGAFLMATCKSASVRFINLSPPMGNILITIYHILYVYIYSYIHYVCTCVCVNWGIFKCCANLLPSTWHLCGHQAKFSPSPPTPPRHAGPPFAPPPVLLLLLRLCCCSFVAAFVLPIYLINF